MNALVRAIGVSFVVLVASLGTASCLADADAPRRLADLDEPYFRCNVQPVLTRSCSMFACHGDPHRFFVVFARNRLRLGISGEAERNATLTAAERERNFLAAQAMVVAADPASSPLLMKPLDVSAGGWFHVGAEIFHGGDPFRDRDDPDYQILEQWVMGASADPACIEPGSDL